MNLVTIVAPEVPEVLECGHPESPHSEVTRGYGRTPDGQRHCYACCLDRDREYMERTGRIDAYLSEDGKQVTNWPGGVLATVTREWLTSAGGFARRTEITRIWARDRHGKMWYGRGPGRGMYLRMTRSKRND